MLIFASALYHNKHMSDRYAQPTVGLCLWR